VVYSAVNNISAAQGTLEFWIKPNWNGNNQLSNYLLSWGTTGGMLFGKDSLPNWRMIANRFQQEQGVAVSASAWQAGVWKHAAFTWNSTALVLYINGSQVAQQVVTSSLPPVSATTFQLGSDGTNVIDAVIDELRISNRARTASEIAADYSLYGQTPACTYSLTPTSLQVPSSGGNLSVAIQTAADCLWAVSGLPNWITVSGASSGTGPATINFIFAPSISGAAASATITVAGVPLSVTQSSSSVYVSSVGNGASFAASFAPGMLMSVFGTGLSSGSPQTVVNAPLPVTSSSGTQVTINGIAAPLLYISSTQINLQIPYEVAVGKAVLNVTSSGQLGSIGFAVQAAAPGIFVDSSNGNIVPNESAAAGSTIGFFVTGAGLVTPSEATGNVPAAGTIPVPNLPVTMTVGGIAVAPVYVGIPSWSVGTLQVNFPIPSTLGAGPQSVVVTIGGIPSQAARLTVK
jgi:uncharacterized protein (TIGR03437 family)